MPCAGETGPGSASYAEFERKAVKVEKLDDGGGAFWPCMLYVFRITAQATPWCSCVQCLAASDTLFGIRVAREWSSSARHASALWPVVLVSD